MSKECLATSIPTKTEGSRIASCMVFSLSCRCELVPVRRDRLRRLFGLGPQSRPGSRLATVCLAPERNRSLAGDFFRGCCAAAPENFFLREHGTDTLFNIQERWVRQSSRHNCLNAAR